MEFYLHDLMPTINPVPEGSLARLHRQSKDMAQLGRNFLISVDDGEKPFRSWFLC